MTEHPRSTQARLAHVANMLHTPQTCQIETLSLHPCQGRVESGLPSYLLHALGLVALTKIRVRENENFRGAVTVLPCFSVMPRGHPQPSPQYTQVSQAIAMSGTEHIKATPRSTVLGQNRQPRFLTPYPKSRLLGSSVTPTEHGHISASTPCVHW